MGRVLQGVAQDVYGIVGFFRASYGVLMGSRPALRKLQGYTFFGFRILELYKGSFGVLIRGLYDF